MAYGNNLVLDLFLLDAALAIGCVATSLRTLLISDAGFIVK